MSTPRPAPQPHRPLTPEHKKLLRLLARVIVDDYLAEIEAERAEKSKTSDAALAAAAPRRE